MSGANSHPPLRRALVGGYQVADVEVALASLELTLSQLQLELEATKKRLAAAETRAADEHDRDQRARDTERRLEEAEAEVARYRETADEVRRLRERLAGAIRELALDLDVDELPATPPAPAPALFETEVELHAGPFDDLASLNAFEQALAMLPGVAEVYVRGLDAGRTTIDLTLHEPAPLLQLMEERLPFVLDVESQDAAHLSLTVQPAPLAA